MTLFKRRLKSRPLLGLGVQLVAWEIKLRLDGNHESSLGSPRLNPDQVMRDGTTTWLELTN
jgi:hypothetical protein